jgi:hypothetical protein
VERRARVRGHGLSKRGSSRRTLATRWVHFSPGPAKPYVWRASPPAPNMYEAVADRNIAIATVEGESRRHDADQDPHDQAYALLPVVARRACNTASVISSPFTSGRTPL